MAGKNTRNPLLTGAGISFPFENFTNSALLVPVSQNEPPLNPEEIEAESFLGQDPPSGPKDIKSLLSSVSNKPPSIQPPPHLLAHVPLSTPQTLVQPLPTPSPGPITVFTQSLTSSASPARPTPLYPNTTTPVTTLHNQFTDLSLQSATDGVNSQPYPPQTSPLFFTNQPPSTASAPTIFTPVPQPTQSNPTVLNSVSQQSQYTSSIFNSVTPQNKTTPTIFTPAVTQLQSAPSIVSSATHVQSTTLFTPAPLHSESTTTFFTPAPLQSESTTTLFTPSAPQSTPNLFTPALPQTQSTSTFFTPDPPQSQSTTFCTPAPPFQPQYTPTVFTLNPHQTQPTTIFTPAPPQTQEQPSLNYFSPAPIPSSVSPVVGNATHPPASAVTPPINQPPLSSNARPPSGGAVNSYRLSNIKRPTYSRPPDLAVAPMPTMPSPLPTVPSAQPSAALFTPCDSPPAPTPVQVSPPTYTPTTNYWSQAPPPSAPQPTSQPAIPVLAPSFASLAQGTVYRPVYHHWFYKRLVEGKTLWQPFSMTDSLALDQAFTSPMISGETKVATDGGRYDVEVLRRRRSAVYWPEEPTEVRRCSWFVKGSMDVRYVPYEENVATMLEEEYRIASTSGEWNRHVQLPDGEVIVIHSPNAIAHHTRSASPDVWGNSPQMQQKPRVVKRGLDEFDIAEGEGERVDHLLFLVHGIGKFCDLKFRPVTEVVNDFRQVSHQLVQSHFREAVDEGRAGRVEVLPVSWHDALHEAHIDARLRDITLTSIPRLRHFTNDTLLDILFYTSPVFCETIAQAVGNEMNRIYNLFLSRNPSFTGGVSLGGHSLGSLILFDMLCNQAPPAPPTPSPQPQEGETSAAGSNKSQEDVASEDEEVRALGCVRARKARLSRTVSYVTIGTAGTGQPFIRYPQLAFHPKAFFALGSPIGMFVTVRGIESLGEDFTLPTCPMFFNIFHPFDPVAYRIESLINSDFAKYSPLLIPHHKGRKRFHLELKDTLEHVGTALKQRLVESVKSTWNTVYQLTMFNRSDGTPASIEHEVTKVIENELLPPGSPTDGDTGQAQAAPDLVMGKLNGGRRVDYVLQEAPLESFNEYLFALSSHVCYWESEDTMLMMLKEIYGTMGVSPDTQVVQQLLPFEMPESSVSGSIRGMDPSAAISDHCELAPPPTSGFIRK